MILTVICCLVSYESDSSGRLFNTHKIISAEHLWCARERERERVRNWDEDVLTTGNLAVLQLEFPFSLLVGFICIDVSSEVVCF